MAEEDLIREEDVLAEGESGEEFLRHEEEQEPEVVVLPPNVQHLQQKKEGLGQEIANLSAQVDQIVRELETRQLAFNQCNALLEQETQT